MPDGVDRYTLYPLTVPEGAVHESATLGAPEPELPVAAAAIVIDNCAEAVCPAESVL